MRYFNRRSLMLTALPALLLATLPPGAAAAGAEPPLGLDEVLTVPDVTESLPGPGGGMAPLGLGQGNGLPPLGPAMAPPQQQSRANPTIYALVAVLMIAIGVLCYLLLPR